MGEAIAALTLFTQVAGTAITIRQQEEAQAMAEKAAKQQEAELERQTQALEAAAVEADIAEKSSKEKEGLKKESDKQSRLRLAQKKKKTEGRRSTILTGPQGLIDEERPGGKTLLGL